MLSIKNLSYHRNDRIIFKPLSFTLQTGALLQITGENGVGKTTLLRILAGLLPLTEGVLQWHHPLTPEKITYIRHANGLKPNLSVAENLHLLAKLRKADVTIKNIAEVLCAFNLQTKAHTLVSQLSAGQQRKVSLCQLALMPSKLWLLDEPFANLDQAGHEVLASLLSAHLTNNGACILTTHHTLSLQPQAEILNLLPPTETQTDDYT